MAPSKRAGNHPLTTRVSRTAWVVIAIVMATLVVRLTLVLTHSGFLGVDGGAYLLDAKNLIGQGPVGIDFTRPPLAPGWMLVPFLHILGDDVGFKVWEAIASVLPLIPAFYLLCTLFLTRWTAVVATAFVSVDLWHSEMLVTGSLPLVGIGLIFLCLWGLTKLSQNEHTRVHVAVVVLAIGLIPFINQTSAGLAAVAVPVYIGSLCVFGRTWAPLRRTLWPLIAGAALGALALPWYGDVLPGSARMSFPGPKLFISPWNSGGWVLIWFAVPFGLWMLARSKHAHTKAIASVLLVHSTLTLFTSYDETIINIFFRSQHVATPLIIMAVAWTAYRLRPHLTAPVIYAGAAALFIAMAAGSVWIFNHQAYYSDMVTPDMNKARAHLPDTMDSVLLTNGFMTGLWLAALEQTPTAWTFSAEPPRLFTEQYANTQCILGWRPGCDPLQAARANNITYVLIDTRFPHINHREPNLWGAPEDTWGSTHAALWLRLLASEGTVRLWKVHHGDVGTTVPRETR